MTASQAEPPDAADRQVRRAVLLTAARDGDQAALNELIADLVPLVWQVARSQGLDREQSADVVQSTWVELISRLHDIHNPNALAAWLVKVAKREAWRTRRRARTDVLTPDNPKENLPAPEPSPEQRALDAERDSELWAAVSKLSQRCQRLLRIVAFVDRPCYADISATLGIPHGSIGPTRGRCLTRLRKLLAGESNGGVG